MKTIVLFLFLICTTCRLSAQYGEVGGLLGASNYLGDLVPPQQYFLGTNFAIGATYQYNFTDRISVRGNLIWGQVHGEDKNSSYGSGRRQRNLDFHSHILELSALAQINILPFHPKRNFKPITPYCFLGVALFHFNPTTVYKGTQYYLQPLGTEGQGLDGYAAKYSLVELSIPFGFGLKFCLTKHLNLSFEFGMRKTFTDYLDDVSGDYVPLNTLKAGNGLLAANLSNRSYDDAGNQIEKAFTPRGSSGKDWYTFMGLSVTYSLHKYIYFEKKKKRKTRK
ncbi:MAG: Unknown protein [uncultured Aureispira sp.]|uniref:DUF6089 domain-containing protein n=1 Tax=uncultured Aureispira sp. TaxID=1331704 RepID=A0A6S6U316_9BACT|nr:MAG: Unknown protein [uncultured Aureispira sp.]